ncbi:MAG TPA: HAD-IA family hydrolase [Balneolaceae bacterium]|nr:HAD-IA family hydrolase [Balneolaceae bacterium]
MKDIAKLPYKFIYFDLDDTLLDHKTAERAALGDVHGNFSIFNNIVSEALAEVYHEVNVEQWLLYSRGDVNREELQRNRFEMTLQQLSLDAAQYEKVGNYYLQCYQNHWQWINGAESMYLRVLQKFPAGLLTNGFAETQRLKFEKFGLHKSATHTVISEEVGVLKPDPKVFQHATELAGVEPDEILYVGDSYSSDIEGGANFGWNTAWFTDNGNCQQYEKADFVFSDCKDLCKFLNV